MGVWVWLKWFNWELVILKMLSKQNKDYKIECLEILIFTWPYVHWIEIFKHKITNHV